jgi:DNA-binding NarL/FixJ family response regulator
MLEPSFEIIGRAGDGQALFEAATKLKPDVIVTDISMPILSGIEAAYKLKESGCTAKIVFLTVHTDSEFVSACLATGASGYVVKPRMAADLLTAIQEALAERVFISTHPTNEKLASHASSD